MYERLLYLCFPTLGSPTRFIYTKCLTVDNLILFPVKDITVISYAAAPPRRQEGSSDRNVSL